MRSQKALKYNLDASEPVRQLLRLASLQSFGVFVLVTLTSGCGADGERSALMLNVYFALRNYASDHDGWFPQSDEDSYAALRKLYPRYCPSGRELAGLSGDIETVVAALNRGHSLSNELTSWVYVQGL